MQDNFSMWNNNLTEYYLGSCCFLPWTTLNDPFLFQDEVIEYGEAIVKGIDDGWLRPLVGVEFDLAEAYKAHEEVIAHKQGTKGKIVLNV